MAAVFATLRLPPAAVHRHLVLHGETPSNKHLWTFSSRYQGGPRYAQAVHACLADATCRHGIEATYREPLLTATGYDVLVINGSGFEPLGADLLSSQLATDFLAWLAAPARTPAPAPVLGPAAPARVDN